MFLRLLLLSAFAFSGPAFSHAGHGHGHSGHELESTETSSFEVELTQLHSLWLQCESACDLEAQEALTHEAFIVAEQKLIQKYHEPFGTHFLLSHVLPWVRNNVWAHINPRTLFLTGKEIFAHYGVGAALAWSINEVLVEGGFYAYFFSHIHSPAAWILGASAAFHLTDISAVVIGGSIPQWWKWFSYQWRHHNPRTYQETLRHHRTHAPIEWSETLHLELSGSIPFIVRRASPFTLAPRVFERASRRAQDALVPTFTIRELQQILRRSGVSLRPFRSLKFQHETYAYFLSQMALQSPLFLERLHAKQGIETLSTSEIRTHLQEAPSPYQVLNAEALSFNTQGVSEVARALQNELQLAILELESTSTFFKDRIWGPRLSAIRAFRVTLKRRGLRSLSALAELPLSEDHLPARQNELRKIQQRLRRQWSEVPHIAITHCSSAFEGSAHHH